MRSSTLPSSSQHAFHITSSCLPGRVISSCHCVYHEELSFISYYRHDVHSWEINQLNNIIIKVSISAVVFSPVCLHCAEFIASGVQKNMQSEFRHCLDHAPSLDLASD